MSAMQPTAAFNNSVGPDVRERRRAHSGPYIHGSARWANAKDLRQSGLLGPKRGLRLFHRSTSDGVYVGSWVDRRGRQHYLRHSGPEHVLCYAPTRSGKGVGL